MHNGKICGRCGVELRCLSNDGLAVEMAIHGAEACWNADFHYCPECGAVAIVGFAQRPGPAYDAAKCEAAIAAAKAAGRPVVRFWVNLREKFLWLAKLPVERHGEFNAEKEAIRERVERAIGNGASVAG